MKKFSFLALLIFSLFLTTSCKDNDGDTEESLDYQIEIMSPDAADKMLGDSIHLHVNFNEADGETIHHIKVRIYQADDESNVVFEKPDLAHIHETSGAYQFHDDFFLDPASLPAHKNWILEAKVWNHKVGEDEVTETVEFHVESK